MNLENLKALIVTTLEDVKALDIQYLDVSKQTELAEMMIFATGTSSQHVKSLAGSVVKSAKEAGVSILGTEGDDVGDWVIVDCGDIVTHILLPEMRSFYSLEQLWSMPRNNEAE